MINGYLMQKAIANYKQREISQLNEKNKAQSTKEKLNNMIERYNRRVEDFLMKVGDKPIKIKDYVPPIKQIERDIGERKNISKLETEAERIKRSIEESLLMRSSFHPLDFTKFVQKPDKLLIENNSINPSIQKNDIKNNESIPSSKEISIKKYETKSMVKSRSLLKHFPSKIRLPSNRLKYSKDKDKKTHFVDLITIASQAISIVNRENKNILKRKSLDTNQTKHGIILFRPKKEVIPETDDDLIDKFNYNPIVQPKKYETLGHQEIEFLKNFSSYKSSIKQPKQEENIIEESISEISQSAKRKKEHLNFLQNPISLAKEALFKCNVINRSFKKQTEMLKIGSGHLISGYGKSNDQLNQDIQCIINSRVFSGKKRN